MPTYRSGVVIEVSQERPGLQKVRVGTAPDTASPDLDPPGGERRHPVHPPASERAYVLTEQIGPVAVGDEVVYNTTAVDLGLGTGGWHFVHWNLTRRAWSQPGPGHIMKSRYTSLQIDTGAAEEFLDDAEAGLGIEERLGGRPVVACTLHSQVPIVAAAYRALRPTDRITYVMTDGAALPLALSDLVVVAIETGLLDTTITAGHAFGGDQEAVSVPSALDLAARGGADCIIVAMGPGVVGTSSVLGTTAVEAAAVLDAAAAMGGRPILCVRASEADARERHRGVSHHVDTVLALCRTAVDVPTTATAEVVTDRHHVIVPIPPRPVTEELADRGVRVTSMGRGPEQDPMFYAAAGAAGTWAAQQGGSRSLT